MQHLRASQPRRPDFCNMTCTSSKHSMLFVDLTVLSNYMTLELWPALRCCQETDRYKWLRFQGTSPSKMSVQKIIIQTLTNGKKKKRKKKKNNPCAGPEGSRRLRLPNWENRHMEVLRWDISPKHRLPLPSRKYSWPFLLRLCQCENIYNDYFCERSALIHECINWRLFWLLVWSTYKTDRPFNRYTSGCYIGDFEDNCVQNVALFSLAGMYCPWLTTTALPLTV